MVSDFECGFLYVLRVKRRESLFGLGKEKEEGRSGINIPEVRLPAWLSGFSFDSGLLFG